MRLVQTALSAALIRTGWALLMPFCMAAAQTPPIRTQLIHKRAANDSVDVVLPLSDGGAYAIASDGGLSRKDAQGKILFTRPPLWTAASGTTFFSKYHHRESPDGEVTLVRTQSTANRCVILKANGDTRLSKELTGNWADVKSAPTAKGGVLLAGSVEKDSKRDVQILQIDPNGLIAWSAFIHWSDENRVTALAPTGDGGFMLAGYSEAMLGRTAFTWLYRINGFGDSLRVDTLGYGIGESIDAIVPMKAGGWLLGGSVPRLGVLNNDFWIRDIDAQGKTRREWIYGDRYHNAIHDLQELEGGGVLVGGTSRPYLGPGAGGIGQAGPFYQPWIQVLAPDGQSLWSAIVEDTVDAMLVKVKATGTGSFWLGCHASYGYVAKSVTFGPAPPVSLAGRSGMRTTFAFRSYDILGRPRHYRAGPSKAATRFTMGGEP